MELPTGFRPYATVWTDERVASWRRTGEPEAVCVWTPRQLAVFLDSVAAERLYAMWWLLALRRLRRGEAAGLRWHNVGHLGEDVAAFRPGVEQLQHTEHVGVAVRAALRPVIGKHQLVPPALEHQPDVDLPGVRVAHWAPGPVSSASRSFGRARIALTTRTASAVAPKSITWHSIRTKPRTILNRSTTCARHSPFGAASAGGMYSFTASAAVRIFACEPATDSIASHTTAHGTASPQDSASNNTATAADSTPACRACRAPAAASLCPRCGPPGRLTYWP